MSCGARQPGPLPAIIGFKVVFFSLLLLLLYIIMHFVAFSQSRDSLPVPPGLACGWARPPPHQQLLDWCARPAVTLGRLLPPPWLPSALRWPWPVVCDSAAFALLQFSFLVILVGAVVSGILAIVRGLCVC